MTEYRLNEVCYLHKDLPYNKYEYIIINKKNNSIIYKNNNIKTNINIKTNDKLIKNNKWILKNDIWIKNYNNLEIKNYNNFEIKNYNNFEIKNKNNFYLYQSQSMSDFYDLEYIYKKLLEIFKLNKNILDKNILNNLKIPI
jgi:hypothetical protein